MPNHTPKINRNSKLSRVLHTHAVVPQGCAPAVTDDYVSPSRPSSERAEEGQAEEALGQAEKALGQAEVGLEERAVWYVTAAHILTICTNKTTPN